MLRGATKKTTPSDARLRAMGLKLRHAHQDGDMDWFRELIESCRSLSDPDRDRLESAINRYETASQS